MQAVADQTPAVLCASLGEVDYLPAFENSPVDLTGSYRRRVENIGRFGYSIYARYHMFYLDQEGHVVPVRHPDGTRLQDLVDYQREIGRASCRERVYAPV